MGIRAAKESTLLLHLPLLQKKRKKQYLLF
jgi:hypothetical protein